MRMQDYYIIDYGWSNDAESAATKGKCLIICIDKKIVPLVSF